jgi:hypothetical protein
MRWVDGFLADSEVAHHDVSPLRGFETPARISNTGATLAYVHENLLFAVIYIQGWS